MNFYVNRRQFLKKSTLVTAGLSISGISFGRKNEVIIGHGDYKYKVLAGWGVLDTGQNPVNDCHEMVEDKAGRLILLTNETKNNVLIYDKSGKLLSTWGNSYPGAHGLTLSNEGGAEYLYICDTNRSQVLKTDLNGKVILKLDYPKESGKYEYPGQYKPTESSVNPTNGHIFVVDGYGLNYVLEYNQKGKLLNCWGGHGDEDAQFKCNHGIIFDTRNEQKNELIITSRQHNCWKKFDTKGEFLGKIEMPGSFICRPVQHGKNLFGAVYRSTSESNEFSGYIQILDENNKVVSTPGGSEPVYVNGILNKQTKEDPANVFMHPHDVCVDRDENLYIPQWASKKTYPIKLERV